MPWAKKTGKGRRKLGSKKRKKRALRRHKGKVYG